MDISAAEWQVMRTVWDRQPVGAADVIAALVPDTGWSHRTVRTLLARLVEKACSRRPLKATVISIALRPAGPAVFARPADRSCNRSSAATPRSCFSISCGSADYSVANRGTQADA